MTYNPALDGLRAFALILVMLFHARAPYFQAGYLGVDVFFVLSGYLITTLLLGELDATGRIDLRAFYTRRCLRLLPALAMFLAAYCVTAPIMWPKTQNHVTQALVSAAFLSDYAIPLFGMPTQLAHTWSLAIEQHFYLIWPFAIAVAFARYKDSKMLAFLAGLYLLAVGWRQLCLLSGQSWEAVYFRFDTRLSGLFLGALVAAMMREKSALPLLARAEPFLLWVPILAIGALRYEWGNVGAFSIGMPLVEGASVAVLLVSTQPGSQIRAMLSMPLLVWIGRLSYGLYLWHDPIFQFLHDRYGWRETILIGAPLSLAAAAFSHMTVERWADAYRNRR